VGDVAGCRAGRMVVPCVTASSVRKRARMASAVVRLRKLAEPPGPDRRPALQQRPSDAVHAVHDAVTGPGDDRNGERYNGHLELLHGIPRIFMLVEPAGPGRRPKILCHGGLVRSPRRASRIDSMGQMRDASIPITIGPAL
jgi:hypothetical protein